MDAVLSKEKSALLTQRTWRKTWKRSLSRTDILNRKFFEKYSRKMHEKIAGIGTTFKFTVDNPEEVFLENGYSRTGRISKMTFTPERVRPSGCT
jgi:hypothetical protein